MSKDISNEVDAELKKHPGVGALVNETTGQVHVFAAAVPYFGLTPAERTALETERNGLLASVSGGGLGKRERRRAEDRIRRIESDLRRARSADESGRRTIERQDERAPQRYGQPGNTVQSVTEAVASAVAAVDAAIGSTPAAHQATKPTRFGVREVNWDKFVAGFTANKGAPKVCCSGPKQYQCSKCRAKAGV